MRSIFFGEPYRIEYLFPSYIWYKGGVPMKLQRAKPALLWLWRVAVVALVNVLVYLMLAAGGPFPL